MLTASPRRLAAKLLLSNQQHSQPKLNKMKRRKGEKEREIGCRAELSIEGKWNDSTARRPKQSISQQEMLLLLVLVQVVLVTTSSGTAQKQGGMAKSFSTGSENAEGRLSAVIGRRRFALGRGPEGWKPTPGGLAGLERQLEERGPGPAD